MTSSRHDRSGIRPAPDFGVGRGHGKRHLLKYERKNQPLLSRRAFARRLATSFGLSLALIAVSLMAI